MKLSVLSFLAIALYASSTSPSPVVLTQEQIHYRKMVAWKDSRMLADAGLSLEGGILSFGNGGLFQAIIDSENSRIRLFNQQLREAMIYDIGETRNMETSRLAAEYVRSLKTVEAKIDRLRKSRSELEKEVRKMPIPGRVNAQETTTVRGVRGAGKSSQR